jgi:hypothetical protein
VGPLVWAAEATARAASEPFYAIFYLNPFHGARSGVIARGEQIALNRDEIHEGRASGDSSRLPSAHRDSITAEKSTHANTEAGAADSATDVRARALARLEYPPSHAPLEDPAHSLRVPGPRTWAEYPPSHAPLEDPAHSVRVPGPRTWAGCTWVAVGPASLAAQGVQTHPQIGSPWGQGCDLHFRAAHPLRNDPPKGVVRMARPMSDRAWRQLLEQAGIPAARARRGARARARLRSWWWRLRRWRRG